MSEKQVCLKINHLEINNMNLANSNTTLLRENWEHRRTVNFKIYLDMIIRKHPLCYCPKWDTHPVNFHTLGFWIKYYFPKVSKNISVETRTVKIVKWVKTEVLIGKTAVTYL